MAYDIFNTIMDRLVEVFTYELQTMLPVTDPLRLKTICKGPLQDDPTLTAPLVIVALDTERGRVPDPGENGKGALEIGGGEKWVIYFKVGARIPRQDTKENAFIQTALLNDRVMRTLYAYSNLRGLRADDGEFIWVMSPNIILQNIIRPTGGGREWYGEARSSIYYRTEAPKLWGNLPRSVAPPSGQGRSSGTPPVT